MPIISEIALLQQTQENTLVLRTVTPVQNLPMLIGQTYGKIAAYLQELGELMTDVPFVCYHTMDMQNLDVEIGFPVARPLPGRDEIQPGVIPEAKVVSALFLGGFDGLEAAYEELSKWIEDKGLVPSGVSYECYYNGPDRPESEYLTKIVLALQ